MIKIINVTKVFGKKVALNNINLEIGDGETLAIIGGSGSGKSTLLRLMIGLIKPTSGNLDWQRRNFSPKRKGNDARPFENGHGLSIQRAVRFYDCRR